MPLPAIAGLGDVLPAIAAADAESDLAVQDDLGREAGPPRLGLREDAQLVSARGPDDGHGAQLFDALQHAGVFGEQVHRPQLVAIAFHPELLGELRHLLVEQLPVEDVERQVELGAEAQRPQPADAGDDDLVERALVDGDVDLVALHLRAHGGEVVAGVAQEGRELLGDQVRRLRICSRVVGQLEHGAVDERVEQHAAVEGEQLPRARLQHVGVGAGKQRKLSLFSRFDCARAQSQAENEGPPPEAHPATVLKPEAWGLRLVT